MTEAFNWLDKIFAFCAIFGGLLFLLRLALMFLGFHGDAGGFHMGDVHVGDVHAGDFHAGDVHSGDIHHGGDAHHGTDQSFKLLTFQGLTGFFLMFGLIGLAMHYQSKFGVILSMIGAVGAGVGTMYVLARLFAVLTRIESSGNVDLKRALGQEGTVYLNIPAEGVGKVQVNVADHLREYEAMSSNKQAIKTGERIRVVWIEGEDLLVVEKI